MKRIPYIVVLTGFLSLFFLLACNEDLSFSAKNELAATVSGIYPVKGKIGSTLTITGENLQLVDSVWIGGGLAQIKYLVNSTEMVVSITKECRTGEVVVRNPYGETESKLSFEISYPVPALLDHPDTAQPKDEIVLSGTDMDVCTKVYFGTTPGIIKEAKEKELIVAVPYFEGSPVEISVEYFDGTASKTVVSGKGLFSLITPTPVVSSYPSSGESGSIISIAGENLNLIEEVWFGSEKGTISQQTENAMNIMIPTNFTETVIVELKLRYYGTKNLLVTPAFEVTLPDLATIYYWENRTTQCQGIVDGNNFFSAQTGEVLTPCDYENTKDNITFYASISGGALQINNPNNSENQTKNFKCKATTGSAVNLPTEVMPTMIRLRTLSADVAEDKKYIDLVKGKTLEEISLDIIKGDNLNYTTGFSNTLKYEAGFNKGDIILFIKYIAPAKTPPANQGIADYSDANIDKIGFIEVVDVAINSTTINNSAWTFNCYYQK